MRDNDWTRVLGWPGYKVYRHEIDEPGKRLKLRVRRRRANKLLVCSGCGKPRGEIVASYEREVRDLPCFEYLTTVVVELYRVRCPDCGVTAEKVPLLPSKAPFSKRFEDAVGQACESAAASRVILIKRAKASEAVPSHKEALMARVENLAGVGSMPYLPHRA